MDLIDGPEKRTLIYTSLKRHLPLGLLLLCAASAGLRAQEAARNPAPPVPASTPAPAIVTQAGRQTAAPQVVTVIHRLSGIKLLRLLRHSDAEASGVNALDAGFDAAKDLHTSFIAGLALDDGRTIVSWLPQAEAEVEMPVWQAATMPPPTPSMMPVMPMMPGPAPVGTISGPATLPPVVAPPAPVPPLAPLVAESPDLADLMVVRRDGQKLAARYLGLDELTGLSLLQVSGTRLPVLREAAEERLFVGQSVRLLAPQRAAQPSSPQSSGTIYLRVGEIRGKLTEITRVSSGRIARLTVRGADLSPSIAGGIALNDAGETIGIIEMSDAHEARIMPSALVRRAAERVLARRASVPRPRLGVSGDAVSALSLESFTAMGWPVAPATTLLNKRQGILLTSVAPGTPAALADLHPGDIILRANEMELKSADDLTFMLKESGAGASVKFTLLRPQQLAPQAISITLSEALSPLKALEMSETGVKRAVMVDPLVTYGAETLALSAQAASRFGASGGLLVVFVKPESVAALSGLRTGDVIESVGGRALGSAPFEFPQVLTTTALGIVRNRQRLEIKFQSEHADRQK